MQLKDFKRQARTLMQFLKLAGLYCNVIRLILTFKSQFITKQDLNANIKTIRTYLQCNKVRKSHLNHM